MFVKGFYFWATAIWGCSNQIGFEEFLNAVGWPPADSLGCQGLLQPLSCEGPGLSRRGAHCQHGHDRSFVCLFLLNMRVFQCRSVRICDNHLIIIEIWLNNSQSSICKSPIIPHFHWLTSNSLCILPTEWRWLALAALANAIVYRQQARHMPPISESRTLRKPRTKVCFDCDYTIRLFNSLPWKITFFYR